MPEVLPIVEQITQNIMDALASVSTVNGYAQTIVPVRFHRTGDKVFDLMAIVSEIDTSADDSDAATLSKRWIQGYAVLLLTFEPESSDYPARKRLQIARADVTKALMLDYHRGNLAIDTTVRAPQWIDNAMDFGAMDGLIYMFDVGYAEDINNPYSLRT